MVLRGSVSSIIIKCVQLILSLGPFSSAAPYAFTVFNYFDVGKESIDVVVNSAQTMPTR